MFAVFVSGYTLVDIIIPLKKLFTAVDEVHIIPAACVDASIFPIKQQFTIFAFGLLLREYTIPPAFFDFSSPLKLHSLTLLLLEFTYIAKPAA